LGRTKKMSAKNSGNNFRKRREKLELSRGRLAALSTYTAEVCPSTIVNIEAGKHVGKRQRAAVESALARAENAERDK